MNNNPNEYPVEEERRKLEVESHFENDLAKPARDEPLSNEFEKNELDQELHKDLGTPMGQHPLSEEYESNELNKPPSNVNTSVNEPHAGETVDMERDGTIVNDAEPNGVNPLLNNNAEPNGMNPQYNVEHGQSFQQTPGEIQAQNMKHNEKEPNSINPKDEWK
ncbi:hypothetical protein H9649_01655 [Sporosarcina sp. Sa2YVA2]|uniref:Uncharacterized protein n=1 Tax=Sporosarcina quadrami TaxID=2762234 RepID=A0ABR8U5G8_9BACL|nr:hypothetical protein [Sporosarcina quadrami]MBD7983271.1 hypothetical protein [Sporosarcina quadrami]